MRGTHSDLVPLDKPVSDEGVVCVVQGRVVGHLRPAAIGVYTVSEELVDGVESVRLDGIVGGEDDELWNYRLHKAQPQQSIRAS